MAELPVPPSGEDVPEIRIADARLGDLAQVSETGVTSYKLDASPDISSKPIEDPEADLMAAVQADHEAYVAQRVADAADPEADLMVQARAVDAAWVEARVAAADPLSDPDIQQQLADEETQLAALRDPEAAFVAQAHAYQERQLSDAAKAQPSVLAKAADAGPFSSAPALAAGAGPGPVNGGAGFSVSPEASLAALPGVIDPDSFAAAPVAAVAMAKDQPTWLSGLVDHLKGGGTLLDMDRADKKVAQRSLGLETDGTIGRETRERMKIALDAHPEAREALQQETQRLMAEKSLSKGETRTLQSLLAVQGLYFGKIDGIGGTQTRTALAAFSGESGVDPKVMVASLHGASGHFAPTAASRASAPKPAKGVEPVYKMVEEAGHPGKKRSVAPAERFVEHAPKKPRAEAEQKPAVSVRKVSFMPRSKGPSLPDVF